MSQIMIDLEQDAIHEERSHVISRNKSSKSLLVLEAPALQASQLGNQDNSSMIDELFSELRNARIFCKKDALKSFIPISELNRLITASVVEEILRECAKPPIRPKDYANYARRVECSAKKLFAILVLSENSMAVCSLLDNELSDQDLPLQHKIQKNQISLLRKGHDKPIEAFQKWPNNSKVENFAREQWAVLAPEFDKENTECRTLPDSIILPFIHLEEEEAKKMEKPHMKIGGYSEVTAYRIHPAHHNFWKSDMSMPLDNYPLIADKKLLSATLNDFLKEKTILDALGPHGHPHLINLLVTYRYSECYHLIFPCADCNLRTYWKNKKFPKFDRQTLLWSLRQMEGITSGLQRVHTFVVRTNSKVGMTRIQDGDMTLGVEKDEEKYGRHGDIKPENILYFKDGNILKITDFGLGRFHGRDSRSNVDPRKVAVSVTYEPPECSLGIYVSRKYDIWSLGCLFLEFVTWLLEGPAEIANFSNARGLFTGLVNDDNFFTILPSSSSDNGKSAEVRVGVLEWVSKLHAHEKCSEVIHNLLDLIMESMLRINPNERRSAEELTADMKTLVSKAELDEKYLLQSAPRALPPPKRTQTPRPAKKPSKNLQVHFRDTQTSTESSAKT